MIPTKNAITACNNFFIGSPHLLRSGSIGSQKRPAFVFSKNLSNDKTFPDTAEDCG
jgi:hypothetical protein